MFHKKLPLWFFLLTASVISNSLGRLRIMTIFNGIENQKWVRELIFSPYPVTRTHVPLCPLLDHIYGYSVGELPHHSSHQTRQPTPHSHVLLFHQPLPH